MRKQQQKLSSYIASPIFGGIALALTLWSAYCGLALLFGYLLFLTMLSFGAYFWGRFSVRNLWVNLATQQYRVYPGQDVEIEFTVKNNKWLPLIWLQWVQPAPKNGCLDTPSDFESDLVLGENGEPVGRVLCKRIPFVKWYATVNWTSVFHARRRGVYMPQPIEIYTGDGFGLSMKKGTYPLESPPVFVVYPQRVEVNTDLFFRNVWSASTGPSGFIEDVTVLRGIRTYEQNDPFKRINWRLAARNDTLNVNLYDTIAPQSVYFFLDTTTFYQLSKDDHEFEETLSVVGSVVSQLSELGMTVGLYLPGEDWEMVATVNRTQTELEDCMLALALCNCESDRERFSRRSMVMLSSVPGKSIYYICRDMPSSGNASLMEDAGIGNYTVLSHRKWEESPGDTVAISEHSVYSLLDLRRNQR